ncbi:DUF3089 domain-containing protein, partial [Bacteroidales bacterium OttesenSCG-928-K03]|nr:DUF3089 domain-containing protein [Bacteroidales bacterium OttesenSCG-928-K03]
MLNKKNKFKLILLSSLILIFCGCNSQPNVNIPPKPDYSNSEFWFENLNIESDKEVDIFYVYPTVTLGGKDDNGNDIYFADITKPEVRNEAYSNQNYNKNVYAADEYNFYAPFYRQISFNVYGLDEKTFKECFQIAVQDVIDAFKYYMENLNNGRPYFLLGHSQGSSMLIELLKHGISDDEFQNMIAAYTIGYSISEADINKYSNRLIPAQDSCDLNCIILFNSLTTIDAI